MFKPINSCLAGLRPEPTEGEPDGANLSQGPVQALSTRLLSADAVTTLQARNTTLPNDVWKQILGLLPPQERHVLSQRLSKDFRDYCQTNKPQGLRLPENARGKYTLWLSEPMSLWLLEEGLREAPLNTDPCKLLSNLAFGGSLENFRFAHLWYDFFDLRKLGYYAAIGGNLEVLKYLHKQKRPWDILDKTIGDAAASSGNLEVLKYVHEQGYPWDNETSEAAAKSGKLEVLKYLHENGCPWDEKTSFAAAESGKLEVLKYAHENGCPWDERTCSRAAGSGKLEVLKYAHENDCPWDERTCYAAAGSGSLEALIYAREQGCPWNSHTFDAAACYGRLDVLIYAHEHGCPYNGGSTGMARGGRNRDVLRYLHQQGFRNCDPDLLL